VINVTFKDISVISWRTVLLVEETGVPGENHRPAVSHFQILSHNVVSPEWYSNYDRIVIGFLPIQSVPITTNVMSSNTTQAIQHYVRQIHSA
jgi:hypothetical protein